ncbi:hypothetical protein [Nitrosomonas sp.]|uniref:hypothetical protein n=1 Tax=Nitrosomonas sp. TaxID=42353 RepID=UPI0025F71D6C|nr:hypothetical protein [Nitrosomonas sp.]MCC6917264.1 hypothetical protein [Nitrosomonas sp.]
MKILVLSVLLQAVFPISHAAESDAALGNPEIESMIETCIKVESQKESSYRQLLAEPYSCGTILVPRPLVARSSEAYRTRFVESRRKMYAESRGNPGGIQELCDTVKLNCIFNNPKFTYSEQKERLMLLFGPPQ